MGRSRTFTKGSRARLGEIAYPDPPAATLAHVEVVFFARTAVSGTVRKVTLAVCAVQAAGAAPVGGDGGGALPEEWVRCPVFAGKL